MPFEKGQSGNPRGKRKGTPNKSTAEVKALARKHGPEAIAKIAKLMRGHDEQIEQLVDELTGFKAGDDEALEKIRELVWKLEARNVQNELGAAKELLDRGYGKSAQPVTGEDGEGPARIQIERIIVDSPPDQDSESL
ncbi:MAG: DUF5681 domain-containing protein [Geminicoccaceae bacterium]